MDFGVLNGRLFTVAAFAALLQYMAMMLHRLYRCLIYPPGRHAPAKKLSSGGGGDATRILNSELDLESKITQLASDRSLEFSRLLWSIFLHIGFAMLFVFLLVRHMHGVWDSDYDGQQLSHDPISFLTVLLVCAMVVQVWPTQLTHRRMDCLHILCIGRLGWQVATCASSTILVFEAHGVTMQRLCIGLTFCNPAVAAVLNVCYFGISCWSYVSKSQGASDVEDVFMPGHIIWFIFDEAFAALVIVATVYAINYRILAEAKATVTAKISRQAEATLSSILLGVCDAVVRLNQEYEVQAGLLQLTAFLLRADSTSSRLNKSYFLDFLDDADRERFIQHIQGSTNDPLKPATSLHVHMRDVNGTLVACQLFNACIHDLDGNRGHIIGIREFSQEEWRPSTSLPVSSEDASNSQQVPTVREAAPRPTPHRSSHRSTANVGRGTPASLTAEHLAADSLPNSGLDDGSDVSVISSVSSRSSRGRQVRLAVPYMKPTSRAAIDGTLIDAMTAWNVSVPRTTCCSWHAYVSELKQSAKRMERGYRCRRDFEPIGRGQCPKCGVVVTEESIGWSCFCNEGYYEMVPNVVAL